LHRNITYYFLIAFLFVAGTLFAKPSPVLRYDSSVVKQLRPSELQERQVFDEVDLGFAKVSENSGENPITRFVTWLMEKIFGNSGSDGRRSMQWAFLWILVGAGLIMAFWLFRRSEFGSFLRGNTKQTGFNFSDLEEDISQIDFNEKVRKAKQDGDLRLALRWLYLKQLFLLNEHGRIAWQPYKTNMDYANELSSSSLKQSFKELSKLYEYVWYGDYPMNENSFVKAESEFAQFEKQIHA
jgi:hypothetical protein